TTGGYSARGAFVVESRRPCVIAIRWHWKRRVRCPSGRTQVLGGRIESVVFRAGGRKSEGRKGANLGAIRRGREVMSMDPILTQLRYTCQEAEDLLRIHVNTLYKHIQSGQIKAARCGGRVFIHREELDRYARGEDTP